MTSEKTLSPQEALDNLLEVIREEALASPGFAARMLNAIGCKVVFQGTDIAGVDPIIAAKRSDFPTFQESFMTFSEKDLKALLTSFALATAEDLKAVRGKVKKPAYIQLMWEGAHRKLREFNPGEQR